MILLRTILEYSQYRLSSSLEIFIGLPLVSHFGNFFNRLGTWEVTGKKDLLCFSLVAPVKASDVQSTSNTEEKE